MSDLRHHETPRLRLDAPRPADLDELHTLYADPAVWTHYPELRHTERATTVAMLERWIADWARDGLGPWIVRERTGPEEDPGPLLGHGGCQLREGAFCNLGYRFTPAAQGHGFATEVAGEAVRAAKAHWPELPVVAYLLEHNHASRRVAEKVGLELRLRGRDAGHPDPAAIRLVLADRPLSPGQQEAVMR